MAMRGMGATVHRSSDVVSCAAQSWPSARCAGPAGDQQQLLFNPARSVQNSERWRNKSGESGVANQASLFCRAGRSLQRPSSMYWWRCEQGVDRSHRHRDYRQLAQVARARGGSSGCRSEQPGVPGAASGRGVSEQVDRPNHPHQISLGVHGHRSHRALRSYKSGVVN